MICRFGQQGSGKSYCMVRDMNYLKNYAGDRDKNVIISNFETELNDIYLRGVDDFWEFLAYLRIELKFGKKRRFNTYIFFDEAGTLFNSRNWQKNFSEEDLVFIAELRKSNVFLNYATQHPSFVDLNFRRMTEELRGYQPWLSLGKTISPGRRVPWGFMETTYEVNAEDIEGGKFEIVKQKRVWLKKKIAKLYDTTELVGSGKLSQESEEVIEKMPASHAIFTRIEEILKKRKVRFYEKILRNISLPSPFYYF